MARDQSGEVEPAKHKIKSGHKKRKHQDDGEAKSERKRKRSEKVQVSELAVNEKENTEVFKVDAAEPARERDDVKETKEERRARKARKRAAKAANGDSAQDDTTNAPQTSPTTENGDSTATGYQENSQLQSLPQTEIDTFLKTHFIAITNRDSPTLRPITTFSHLPKTDLNLTKILKGFSSPTPIQAAAWPYALSGRDVVGVAETGSGKTLAFGIPLAQMIVSSRAKKAHRKGIKALVVSPTRELAMQSHAQMAQLAADNDFRCACIYGGMPKDEQRMALARAHVVIATPGRLNDFIQEGFADLSGVVYTVLDEADRMLDKGFEDEIRKIVAQTSTAAERQVLMFTATWPASIRELAATFMRNPVKITIGDNPSGDLRANTSIKQIVEVVDPRQKEVRLQQLLKTHQAGSKKNDRILVFCLYKKEAVRIENYIRTRGFNVAGIHGDLSQPARTKSLDAFKAGNITILVATDVAARGLDIPAVKLVINCTFPLTAEDYVHRIGRTGRAGAEGLAITLFTEHDKALSGALINVLKAAKQDVPDELLKFGGTVKKKTHDVYGAFYREGDEGAKSTKITFD